MSLTLGSGSSLCINDDLTSCGVHHEELTQVWLRRNGAASSSWLRSLRPWSSSPTWPLPHGAACVGAQAWIDNWRGGAIGERWTGRALRALEAQGWHIFHDLAASYGNIDHAAVGPGGVFLPDSKRWKGSVTVEADSAVVRRLKDPDLLWRFTNPAHVKGLAREVHEWIRASTRTRIGDRSRMV